MMNKSPKVMYKREFENISVTDQNLFLIEELKHCYDRIQQNHSHSDKLEYFSLVALFALLSYIFTIEDSGTALWLSVVLTVSSVIIIYRIYALEHYLGLLQKNVKLIEQHSKVLGLVHMQETERSPLARHMRRFTWGVIATMSLGLTMAIYFFGTFWIPA